MSINLSDYSELIRCFRRYTSIAATALEVLEEYANGIQVRTVSAEDGYKYRFIVINDHGFTYSCLPAPKALDDGVVFIAKTHTSMEPRGYKRLYQFDKKTNQFNKIMEVFYSVRDRHFGYSLVSGRSAIKEDPNLFAVLINPDYKTIVKINSERQIKSYCKLNEAFYKLCQRYVRDYDPQWAQEFVKEIMKNPEEYKEVIDFIKDFFDHNKKLLSEFKEFSEIYYYSSHNNLNMNDSNNFPKFRTGGTRKKASI